MWGYSTCCLDGNNFLSKLLSRILFSYEYVRLQKTYKTTTKNILKHLNPPKAKSANKMINILEYKTIQQSLNHSKRSKIFKIASGSYKMSKRVQNYPISPKINPKKESLTIQKCLKKRQETRKFQSLQNWTHLCISLFCWSFS